MKQNTTRRGFLVTLGRIAAFVGLGALVVRLAGRAGEEAGPDSPRNLCRRCRSLDTCSRPDGVKVRRETGDGQALSVRRAEADRAAAERGLCGERLGGELVSRWINREKA